MEKHNTSNKTQDNKEVKHDHATSKHNTEKPKGSSGCKSGSCSTAEKKGKTTHTQDESTGSC